jgi:hypothetical protein
MTINNNLVNDAAASAQSIEEDWSVITDKIIVFGKEAGTIALSASITALALYFTNKLLAKLQDAQE